MSDVFDRLVGQDRAVAAMRQYARNPVHAYLFSGPGGSSLHDALVTFAAALQCPRHGCGECEICRLVLDEGDPDVYMAERSGVSWRMEEVREAERVARRRPLGEGYQIVVLEDIELTTTGTSVSAPALLKSLEEPPPRTIFLLSAEELPPELDTIVSRALEVRLRALGDEDVEKILISEGAHPETARMAASAAAGNLRRARVLVRDHGLVARVERWRTVPARLSGTTAASAIVAADVASDLDEALAPLQELQREELARRTSEARELGLRVGAKRDVEAQFKREQRRFRLDELRFGLRALTGVYRDRLVENVTASAEGDARSDHHIDSSLRALDVIAETTRRLSTNVDETLLLHDLMFSLMAL
jgi:DNA polymerase-3 subunit delta'